MPERVQSELENLIIQGIKVSGEMLGKLIFMGSLALIVCSMKKLACCCFKISGPVGEQMV
jgi:hypothetical protein